MRSMGSPTHLLPAGLPLNREVHRRFASLLLEAGRDADKPADGLQHGHPVTLCLHNALELVSWRVKRARLVLQSPMRNVAPVSGKGDDCRDTRG